MSASESFGRSAPARFINSPAGRLARVIAGVVLIAWGYATGGTATGLVLMAAGLVPLATGAFDLCLISAVLGGPIRGALLRQRTGD